MLNERLVRWHRPFFVYRPFEMYLAGYIEQVVTDTNDVIDRCVE